MSNFIVKPTKSKKNKNANEKLKKSKLFNQDVHILDFNFRQENGKHSGLSYSDIQAGEGLCAVSMIKRFFRDKETEEFPSTSEIATMATIEKLRTLDDTILKSNINFILKTNSQFLYEDAITLKNIQKVLDENGQQCPIELIPQWQCTISKAAKDNNLTLSKYYAILAFDADGMGSKIGKCKNKEEVLALSTALAKFGDWAKAYIDDNKYGKTVYAGGDDFLGFMNLNHVFPALQKMREEFDTQVNAKQPKHLQLSFSAGIAVAHYKTPLSEVLNYARLMEKKAKGVQNEDESVKKDAFAIAVLKHSGEIHDTVWRFRDKDENSETTVWATSIIDDLIHHLRNKDVSDKFMTNLADEFAPMLNKKGTWGQEDTSTDTDEDTAKKLDAILKFELKRFLKRADSKTNPMFKPDDFANKLYALYEEHTAFDLSVQNFINLLFISEFISRDINKTATINQPLPQN
jgi:CRISPR-associated protein Cmr2